MWMQLDHRYKSLTAFERIDLPDLVVLSGENGAGKSHLLLGIAETQVKGDWNTGRGPADIRFLTSEQLGNPQELQIGGEGREQLVARFEATMAQAAVLRSHEAYPTHDSLISAFQQIAQQVITPTQLSAIELAAGKPLVDWTHDDYSHYTPSELMGGDLFAVSVGEIFSRYNQVITANELEALRAGRGATHGPIRTDEEIHQAFGRPPWDLLNGALESVGLPFRFTPPDLSMMPIAIAPLLRHVVTGEGLPVSALSSGEKTLLSIALSVYSASSRSASLQLPSIVLLDEPDATLHPSMIQSLLRLLQDQFVVDLGIKVVITTHSPTTVALAPDDSLYVMHKWDEPRLEKAASKDAALSNLLVGVATIAVSAENRRVVVVESPHDERRYKKIASLLSDHLQSPRSLVFTSAGTTDLPDGSAAVIGLVERLRSGGNISVWGLVDRDSRTTAPHPYVHVDLSRYTMENFVVDPLSLGLYLLLENFGPATTALSGIDYVNFDPARDSQRIVDWVAASAALPNSDLTNDHVSYVGGFACDVPRFWMDEPGHELVKRLPAAFSYLARFEHDQGRLLDQIIDRVWTSRPGLIPQTTLLTLSGLLNA